MAGHQMIEFVKENHQFPVAGDQVCQATAFQVRPHRTVKQNVAAEEYPVGPIQKADVVRGLARRINDFQVGASQVERVTFGQPTTDLQRWHREGAAIKAPWPRVDQQILSQNFGPYGLLGHSFFCHAAGQWMVKHRNFIKLMVTAEMIGMCVC